MASLFRESWEKHSDETAAVLGIRSQLALNWQPDVEPTLHSSHLRTTCPGEGKHHPQNSKRVRGSGRLCRSGLACDWTITGSSPKGVTVGPLS